MWLLMDTQGSEHSVSPTPCLTSHMKLFPAESLQVRAESTLATTANPFPSPRLPAPKPDLILLPQNSLHLVVQEVVCSATSAALPSPRRPLIHLYTPHSLLSLTHAPLSKSQHLFFLKRAGRDT